MIAADHTATTPAQRKPLSDGLIDAKRNGIKTPLSDAYEQQILRVTETTSLRDALNVVRLQ